MANGNRDVSLVIRAKNEASRTLDTISSSLDELRKSQNSVDTSGTKTGNTLQKLGTELGKLRQQVGGANSLDKLAGSMEKAAGAVANLEAATAKNRQEQTALQADLQKTSDTSDRLSQRQQSLTDRLRSQSQTVDANKQAYNELTAQIQQNETALTRSGQKNQQYVDRLTRQENALEKTRTQYRQLAQQISVTEAPTNKMLDAFEKAETRLTRQQNTLEGTKQEFREYQQSVAQTAVELPKLRRAQDQANSAFRESEAAQSRTSRALSHVEQASRQVEQQNRRTQTSIDRNAQTYAKQTSALERSRSELAQVEQTAEKANVSMDKIGNTIRRNLLGTLRESQQELARYRQEWQQAQQAVRAGIQGGGDANNPSPELQRQLEIARQQKTAYEQTRAALHQYRQALRSAGTDVNKLAIAHKDYQAALSRIDKTTEQVAAATKQKTTAHRADTQALRDNDNAMTALERRGRAAMTWAQRLRGEVIALTLSYVGLYAAMEQLRGVTRAFLELEAANNRMLVAFNGNDAISSREMRWVREEADQLGIQFGILAQEYSKFAIAARGTNIEGAEARRIFESVTVAARVNKLSIDQMEGTFLALSQMMSKGVVSMEELRRQMGDRLYGAFTLAAEGMGITTAELDKLVSSGSLASETFLPRFADRLEEVFGPQLSTSLDTFTTDLGRFQNELFKTQLRVAEGGFIEGLREALISLTNYMQSDDGVRFFENLGAAAGAFVKLLAEIPNYFREIMLVLAAFGGVRLVAGLSALRQRFAEAVAAARPLPATLNAASSASRNAQSGFGALSSTTRQTSFSLAALQGRLRGTATMLSTVQGRAVAAGRAMTAARAGLSMVGGVPGLLVTGVSLALTTWLTRSQEVVDVTGEHETQMQRLLDEYSRIKQAAGDWGAALESGIEGISLDSLESTFTNLLDKYETDLAAAASLGSEAMRAIVSPSNIGDEGIQEYGRQIVELSQQLKDGELTAKDYRSALANMLRDRGTPQKIRDLIRDSAALNKALVETEGKLLESAAGVVEFGGSIDELPSHLTDAVRGIEDLARAAGLLEDEVESNPLAALNKQIEELRGKIPSMGEELKLMEDLSTIDQIIDTATAIEGIDDATNSFREFLSVADGARSFSLQGLLAQNQVNQRFEEFLTLARQAKAEIQETFDAKRFQGAEQAIAQVGASSAELSANLLRRSEGFREEAYPDWTYRDGERVNSGFRAGFGSDTITLADGSIQKVVEGMRVTVAQANDDLARRITEFQATARGQLGGDTWGGLNAQQQAVLTSIAYNYGSLPDRLVSAFEEGGSATTVAEAIRGLAGDNNGINAERRNEEAYLYGRSGAINEDVTQKYVDEQIKLHEQQVEKAAEYNTQLDRTLERRAEELRYVDGLSREMTVSRAVEDERLNAAKAGVQLSAEQLNLIKQNAAEAWDQKAAEEAIREAKEAQSAADQRLNMLIQHRRDLMEQIEFYQEQGDGEAVRRLKEQLVGVTDDVRTAIDGLIAFWEAAMTGAEGEEEDKAAAAIARLQTLRNSLVETGEVSLLTAEKFGEVFGNNLIQGANNFLAKIRETGNVIGSLKDAFLQFASDFLLKIAQMIMQQMIFNALQAAAGASGGGGFWGAAVQAVGASVNHDGGVIGSTSRSRNVSAGMFTNAVRYHTGGVAGLKANEVPAVLERGEEVLTANDPRHRNNQGGGSNTGTAPTVNLKNINLFDAADMLETALADVNGQRVMLNYVNENSDGLRGALNL